MRQEEEIQELQAVDGDLLLNGQGEEVNPHGNVIAGGHLRAEDHAVIPTVNNPDLHLFIMVHKAWLLVVLEIGGAHIQPIPPRFFEGEAGGNHIESPDADSVRSLDAFRLDLTAAGVYCGNDAGAHRIAGECDVIHVSG